MATSLARILEDMCLYYYWLSLGLAIVEHHIEMVPKLSFRD